MILSKKIYEITRKQLQVGDIPLKYKSMIKWCRSYKQQSFMEVSAETIYNEETEHESQNKTMKTYRNLGSV